MSGLNSWFPANSLAVFLRSHVCHFVQKRAIGSKLVENILESP